jgi:lysophospholipase L1-like esterase
MRLCKWLLLGLALCAWRTRADDNDLFYLKDGDRVVFYGDSITDQRLYTVFTETYVVTRFPDMDVTFTHSGWGGDRVTGGGGGNIDTRLQRDVIPYKPTVMTIMLGMNDGSYRAFDTKIFQTYTNGYDHIIETVKKEFPDIRLTLIEPSPYDDVTRKANFEGGYNAVLLRYSDFVADLAAREHATIADLNRPVVEMLEKADKKNHELALKLLPDRVHPSPGGHLIMAEQILKAWHAPSLVTDVEIDATAKKAGKTDGTKLSDLSFEKGIKWHQKDHALPMPVNLKDRVVALALDSSDFTEALNREMLKVTGLTGEKYSLAIDGEEVGNFTRAELTDGINLALLPTPMAKQAAQVHHLTVEHNDLHFTRWRQIQVKYSSDLPHFERALKGLDSLESDLVKKQREAAQPKERKYELILAE